jgi:predicted RNA-binding Zn-ribbon protein involved in translation (DUF1610 family)
MSLDVSSIPSLDVTGCCEFKLIPDVIVPVSPMEACSSCSERMDVLTRSTSFVFNDFIPVHTQRKYTLTEYVTTCTSTGTTFYSIQSFVTHYCVVAIQFPWLIRYVQG